MTRSQPRSAAVIGGGPAGLMAAEVLSAAGVAVTVYDRMPSVGRKFLMAGRGGLNLTHSEASGAFLSRYGAASGRLAPLIAAFPPEALIEWCRGLGQPTFVGSSGRVFPVAMKASPLLRAWLGRLASQGVVFAPRHAWTGWDGPALQFDAPNGRAPAGPVPEETVPEGMVPGGMVTVRRDVTVLAVGGASWPRLGSDAAWTGWMAPLVAPFRPANCGFTVDWTTLFRDRFAGRPLKRLALRFGAIVVRGEAVVTATGLEGGAIYALSGPLRDAIAAAGSAVLQVDLRPDLDAEALRQRLAGPERGQSLSNRLRKRAGLSAEAIGLVQEALHVGVQQDLHIGVPDGDLAGLIKALPLRLTGTAPIGRAISSAGGLRWEALDDHLMLHDRPGVFAAGEMLDWEAPTGGYLLQACFSTGAAAALGALGWLANG